VIKVEVISVSLPHELKETIKNLQKSDKRFGWTAIFCYGYKRMLEDDPNIAADLNVKIEKLATKLNFYVQKSVFLEEELDKIKAEKGV
jgi:hypothetical protein